MREEREVEAEEEEERETEVGRDSGEEVAGVAHGKEVGRSCEHRSRQGKKTYTS